MERSVDEKWMRLALEEAKIAFEAGEVPIGAVIVKNGEPVSKAHNLCEQNTCATAHAELLAINEACRVLKNRRLSDCTLYVTLEPCPMCTGALINARVGRVVFAAKDPRAGAMGSLLDLPKYPLEARPTCEFGLMEAESLELLRLFFAKMRQKSKKI